MGCFSVVICILRCLAPGFGFLISGASLFALGFAYLLLFLVWIFAEFAVWRGCV